MFWKKIRHGLDLRGNGIINSYVENPITNNQIANKIYVDLGDTFNTPNAIAKPTSTKFPWVINYANLPIKEVLDKLLFPVVYPEYKNPILESYKIYNFGNINNVIGDSINGRLNYKINNYERTPTLNYKLIVKYVNNTELTFTDNNSVGYINFNFTWNNVKSIKLKQVFSPSAIKNDSDGNPFIDNNFQTTYDFEYSFELIEFENIFGIIKGIYSLSEINDTNLKTYLSMSVSEILAVMNYGNLLTLKNQLTTDLENHNNTLILLPELLLNKLATITFSENNKPISSLRTPINKYLIYNENNEKYLITINNEKYYFCLIDFGKYSSIINVLISF